LFLIFKFPAKVTAFLFIPKKKENKKARLFYGRAVQKIGE